MDGMLNAVPQYTVLEANAKVSGKGQISYPTPAKLLDHYV